MDRKFKVVANNFLNQEHVAKSAEKTFMQNAENVEEKTTLWFNV